MKFNKKFNYIKHKNKKFDCTTKISESNSKSNTDSDNKNNNCILLNITENIKHPIEINEKKDTIEKNIDKKLNKSSEFYCGFCLKKFLSKGTLTRHLKINCKIKKENDEEKENIFKLLLKKDEQINNVLKSKDEQINKLIKQNETLLNEIKNLKNKSNKINSKKNKLPLKSCSIKISNSNNTINTFNNQTNNIVMFNFGKEDLKIIDKDEYLERVVKKPLTGVKIPEEILKIIHFNPKYPQLSNIYISDINREKCMVWEDGTWKLSPVDKIPEVIDKVVDYSNEVESELRDIFNDNKKINDRLNIVNKYIKMNDLNYIDELKEDNDLNIDLLRRCEEFQKYTYLTFKTALYNEGKNIKKIVKTK
jgi:hypothetical protein